LTTQQQRYSPKPHPPNKNNNPVAQSNKSLRLLKHTTTTSTPKSHPTIYSTSKTVSLHVNWWNWGTADKAISSPARNSMTGNHHWFKPDKLSFIPVFDWDKVLGTWVHRERVKAVYRVNFPSVLFHPVNPRQQ
jgi:hypothetical protein